MSQVAGAIGALAVLGALALSGTVSAQGAWYVGAGFGATEAKFENGFASGIAGVTESSDKSDKGGKIFVGYQFNRFFGLEFGFADLGKFTYDYADAGLGEVKTEFHATALNFSGNMSLPLTDAFSLLVRGGLARTRAEREISSSSGGLDAALAAAGVANTGQKSKSNLTWGFGAQFNLSRAFGLRLDYDNYGKIGESESTGRARAHMWSANAVVSF